MKQFIALLKKDFTIESRTLEILTLQIAMALLLSTVCAVGIQGAFLKEQEVRALFPSLIWIVFVFSTTLAVSRSFEYEFKNDAIYRLMFSGYHPANIYLSKFVSNTIVSILGQMITITLLAILLNVSVSEYFSLLLFISVLVSIGFSAISTLLTPFTLTSRLRSMLLPLILLPLLFPILFAGLELTATLLDHGTLDLSSIWISLALGFDVIYITLGFNLFEKIILE